MNIVDATYRDGAFHPKAPIKLPEGSEVSLQIVETSDRPESVRDRSGKTIEEQVAELARQIDTADWESLPGDLNHRLDAHLYETPEG